MCRVFLQSFADAHLPLTELVPCDARNQEEIGTLLPRSGFVMLCGGHVPTQNHFFAQLGLPGLFHNYHGIVLGVSVIPGGGYNLLANCLTSFACGMQVESFRKIHGHGIATTMCIGNLRNALQNVDDYIITHRRGFLENGLLYFGVIFTFVFGAVLGNWCIERMGLHAIVVASLLLFVAFVIMFIDRERDLRLRWKVAAEAWKEGCRK